MIDSAGLNLGSRDLLRGALRITRRQLYFNHTCSVFSKPNSFLFVSAITIDNTPVKDFDLTHIHHLPQLSMLSLCNTGLGNEAFVPFCSSILQAPFNMTLNSIYHLISLKWRLRKLYINSNPRIDDDAIAPLLLLSKLVYLTIFDTRVSITGLRRLALELHEAQRHFRVEVSESCYCYIESEFPRSRPMALTQESQILKTSTWSTFIPLSLMINLFANTFLHQISNTIYQNTRSLIQKSPR
jgi:hypothetical protein